MFDRSDPSSIPTCLPRPNVSQFGWSAVSPSRPALSQSAACSGGQGKRAAARSHAQPPLRGEHGEHGEHWTLMAAARGATLDQAEGVRTSASASHNPYSASGSGSGSPSKSVTATPSISVILLKPRLDASGFRFRRSADVRRQPAHRKPLGGARHCNSQLRGENHGKTLPPRSLRLSYP